MRRVSVGRQDIKPQVLLILKPPCHPGPREAKYFAPSFRYAHHVRHVTAGEERDRDKKKKEKPHDPTAHLTWGLTPSSRMLGGSTGCLATFKIILGRDSQEKKLVEKLVEKFVEMEI